MAVLNQQKALRSLYKTPIILGTILRDVTSEQAQEATDGPDGWSVLYIVCHLRDYESIFYDRVQSALQHDTPRFPPVDNDGLIHSNDYATQSMREAFDAYQQKREQFMALLSGLSDAQWMRKGIHPATGEGAILDLAINTALHDVNHTEQIIAALHA